MAKKRVPAALVPVKLPDTEWLVVYFDLRQGTWREWHCYADQHSAECAAGLLNDRQPDCCARVLRQPARTVPALVAAGRPDQLPLFKE